MNRYNTRYNLVLYRYLDEFCNFEIPDNCESTTESIILIVTSKFRLLLE